RGSAYGPVLCPSDRSFLLRHVRLCLGSYGAVLICRREAPALAVGGGRRALGVGFPSQATGGRLRISRVFHRAIRPAFAAETRNDSSGLGHGRLGRDPRGDPRRVVVLR